jgi:predicted transcriptional regulator
VRASLFDLEAEIMEVVWSRRWDEFSVGDVHTALQGRRNLAYTTVMTVVSRLYQKQLLWRRRDGKRYVYRARMTREEFCRTTARDVMKSLLGPGGETALALLVERVADASAEDLDALEELIARRRREIGS